MTDSNKGESDEERSGQGHETWNGDCDQSGHGAGVPEVAQSDSGDRCAEAVGDGGQESDGRIDEDPARRTLITHATYWSGSVPSPADMAAFKAVDPTFPERIMRMTEQTVETQNKALLYTSKLESIALTVTSIGYTVLPWVVAIILAFTGHDVAAAISAVAGLAETGPKLVNAIRNRNDSKGEGHGLSDD